MLTAETSVEREYTGIVAGVDEAGRGPWAGPVVAAAVILPAGFNPEGINDSKKLSTRKRDELHERICAETRYGVGEASVQEIDTLNILQATFLAMTRAVEALNAATDMILVDGNRLPKWPHKARAIVGGDASCLCIAAASIVAKVTRDRMMCALAQAHPGYGWDTNAGYGTRAHQDGIASLGITPHHRTSYAPIRKFLQQVS